MKKYIILFFLSIYFHQDYMAMGKELCKLRREINSHPVEAKLSEDEKKFKRIYSNSEEWQRIHNTSPRDQLIASTSLPPDAYFSALSPREQCCLVYSSCWTAMFFSYLYCKMVAP